MGKLADAYRYEMTPGRAEGEAKPFSQYIRMMRTCVPKDDRSRLAWAMERYPECKRLYCSPLFELLERNCSQEDLVGFARELWTQRRIDLAVFRQLRKSLSIALRHLLNQVLWSNTRDVENVKDMEHLDALCLLLIAQRASTDLSEKKLLSQWSDGWINRWAKSHPDMQNANACLDELVGGYVHATGESKPIATSLLHEQAADDSLIATEWPLGVRYPSVVGGTR